MFSDNNLVIINAACTWFMTGLIWMVQVVHYPLFAGVGADAFATYHRRHTRRITLIVVGPMVVEAMTAVWLAVRPPSGAGVLAWVGVGLVGLIWLSTAALQVPNHNRLSAGFDTAVGRALCAGNWVRTAAWTARAMLTAALLLRLTAAGRG